MGQNNSTTGLIQQKQQRIPILVKMRVDRPRSSSVTTAKISKELGVREYELQVWCRDELPTRALGVDQYLHMRAEKGTLSNLGDESLLDGVSASHLRAAHDYSINS